MRARHVTTPEAPQPPTPARTNAGVLTRGDRATNPTTGPPPRRWDYWPTALRRALDVAGVAVLVGVLFAYRANPEAATAGALVLGAVALAGAGWVSAGAALSWRHRRDVVRPLARAIGPAIGRHEREGAGGWLDVPVTFPDDPAVIRLPHRLDEGARATVEAVTARHLGSDLDHDWHTGGHRPRVEIRPRQHPPRWAIYGHDEAATDAVEAAAESAPAIGLATGGTVVAVDFDSESPHVLIAAAPGGGKSTIVRAIAAQVLHNGGHVVIVDLKKRSHRWAKGLPAVLYAADVIDAHDALVAVGAEVERRNAIDTDDDELDVPRLLVVVEEANTTMARLKRYYDRELRERGGPKDSPAVIALAETCFMARAVRTNVIAVAQSGTVNALGMGPEGREAFAGARILSRYSRNAWQMLGPEHPFMPASHHTGRVVVMTAGRAPRAVQVIHLDDDQARELATTGPALRGAIPLSPSPSRGAVHQGEPVDVSRDTGPLAVVRALPAGEPPEPLYTLGEAVRAGVIPGPYDTVKRARTRGRASGAFPPADTHTGPERYYAATLQRWHRSRPNTPPSDWQVVERRPTPRAAGEGGE